MRTGVSEIVELELDYSSRKQVTFAHIQACMDNLCPGYTIAKKLTSSLSSIPQEKLTVFSVT
jgi:hypothetical protein